MTIFFYTFAPRNITLSMAQQTYHTSTLTADYVDIYVKPGGCKGTVAKAV